MLESWRGNGSFGDGLRFGSLAVASGQGLTHDPFPHPKVVGLVTALVQLDDTKSLHTNDTGHWSSLSYSYGLSQ